MIVLLAHSTSYSHHTAIFLLFTAASEAVMIKSLENSENLRMVKESRNWNFPNIL